MQNDFYTVVFCFAFFILAQGRGQPFKVELELPFFTFCILILHYLFMTLNLDSPLEKISGVGQFFLKKFNKLGVKTIFDLLFYFPFRYENFAEIKPISELKLGEIVTVQGTITDIKTTCTFYKKMNLIQVIIKDQSGSIRAIWFNQKYLTKVLKIGQIVSLSGKIGLNSNKNLALNENFISRNKIFISNPVYEIISSYKLKENNNVINTTNYTHTGRLVPIYSETQGISSRWIRQIIWSLLAKLKEKIIESLPEIVRKEHQLMDIQSALQQIHFPDSLNMAEKAREYFAFQKLFILILSVLREKKLIQQNKAPLIPIDVALIKKFVSSLPFKLTDAQKKATWKILKDLKKPFPMNRLLEGDVGSGKTMVAIIAILNTIQKEYQVALMAPTEILAKQHFDKISNFLENYSLAIALLTGKQDLITSKKLKGELIPISRQKIIERVEEGTIDLLIGTHALIQDKVKFNNLGLVIIDEQHRFGIKQRSKLIKTSTTNFNKIKSEVPHFLSMTATPIPRTLALTIYSDLDLSLIDEMPKNRKRIITKILSEKTRDLVYKFIKQEIKKDKQVFVVCPRIDISNDSNNNAWAEVKAVTEEYRKLSKIFPDVKIAVIHSKIKITEKNKIMQDFQANKTKILVCTSVIEVGIDIPNATIMIIEGAERFGLAQLYQIRGRIGRREEQSYCFLATTSQSLKTNQRINALIKAKSSFELAEKDLQIRGPGEFMGVKQSGFPDIAMEGLKDIKLVEKAKESAQKILEADPLLNQYPILKQQVMSFRNKIHFE